MHCQPTRVHCSSPPLSRRLYPAASIPPPLSRRLYPSSSSSPPLSLLYYLASSISPPLSHLLYLADSISPPLSQVCSAVHNQDYTVVDDYITGLKCLLYMRSSDQFVGWNGQSQPTTRHQLGKPIVQLPTDEVLSLNLIELMLVFRQIEY